MQFTIVPTENPRPSCIGFDDTSLMISSQTLHSDFESLQHYTASFQKSGTNGYGLIPLKDITAIQYHERHKEFYVQYRKEGSPRLIKYHFSIVDDQLCKDFCASLAQASGLYTIKEFENPFVRIWEYLLFIGLSIIFTYVAQSVANGGLAYSRKAIVHLVAQVLEMIGPVVPIVLGTLLVCYYLYKIIYNYIWPTKTVLYS